MTQVGAGWENHETEAQQLVQNYERPDMQYTLKDQQIEFGNAARAKRRFVGTSAWSTRQDEGPLYKVNLVWKQDSAIQKTSSLVNLEDGSVTAETGQAKAFIQPPPE